MVCFPAWFNEWKSVGTVVKPAGEWNSTRITVNYPHVELAEWSKSS
jgi:hypothetical protein